MFFQVWARGVVGRRVPRAVVGILQLVQELVPIVNALVPCRKQHQRKLVGSKLYQCVRIINNCSI